MEVGLYGVNPTIPYRRLLVRSPLPTISLTSASQPRALISPSCNFPAPSKIVIASGDASSIRMRELSKATASSPVDVIHSLLDQRSPSLRQTKLIILACSIPEFDFVDFDRNLKSSSPTRAQESSLCAKVASSLCLCLYWPNQTSLSPICSCVCNIRQVNCCKESHCQNPIIHSSQKWIIPSIISDRESGECSPFFFARDPSFEKNDFVVSFVRALTPEADVMAARSCHDYLWVSKLSRGERSCISQMDESTVSLVSSAEIPTILSSMTNPPRLILPSAMWLGKCQQFKHSLLETNSPVFLPYFITGFTECGFTVNFGNH